MNRTASTFGDHMVDSGHNSPSEALGLSGVASAAPASGAPQVPYEPREGAPVLDHSGVWATPSEADTSPAGIAASFQNYHLRDTVYFLPRDACVKWLAIKQLNDDAHVAMMPILEEINDHRELMLSDKNHVKRMMANPRFEPEGHNTLSMQKRIDHHASEIKRLSELRELRSQRWTQINQCMFNIKGWLDRVVPVYGTLAGAPTFEFELRKNESFATAVERCRRRGREILADIEKAVAAPIPSGVAKKLMRDQIGRIAERGVPNVFALVQGGGEIRWPARRVDANVAHSRATAIGLTHEDGVALSVWLNRKALESALDGEIDAVSDDKNALTESERKQVIVTSRRDLLAIEREEEFWIEKAAAQGTEILRRPDADPRAVLGLVDDLPSIEESERRTPI